MILVLKTVKAYGHLFSEKEKELIDTYLNKISGHAQTIIARLLQRKRKWYTVSEHLQKYVTKKRDA